MSVPYRDILAALRRLWWLPILTTFLGGLSGYAFSAASTPLYTSNMQLFVSTTEARTATDFVQGSQFSQERVASYAQLLMGEELASRVSANLGLDMEPAVLAGKITATPVPSTVLIDVEVRDTSGSRARDIAGQLGSDFIEMVRVLETTPGASAPVRVTVVEGPSFHTAPSFPNTRRNTALGLALGLPLGLGLVVARTRLDRSVRDPETVGDLARAPVIGMIMQDPVLDKQHVFDRTSTSPAAEGYRRLTTNLQFIDVDEPPRTIMISSAIPGEGKTTLTLNLAIALAEAGRQVAVVEADLRRPRVTRYLGMVGGVGLTNVLAGTAELNEVLQGYGDESLSVLAAGPLPPNPSQLLSSAQMKSLMEELATKNDFVLVDAPPVLPVADATSLAVLTDGVLLSVRYGFTRKDLVRRTAAALEQVGARTLGVVLNVVPPRAEVSLGYGYRYDLSSAPRAPRHRWRRVRAGSAPE
ncbi:polysaccharide biosynthesis tyrosine autokinase [Geodermatophilus sp. SYSU D00742]